MAGFHQQRQDTLWKQVFFFWQHLKDFHFLKLEDGLFSKIMASDKYKPGLSSSNSVSNKYVDSWRGHFPGSLYCHQLDMEEKVDLSKESIDFTSQLSRGRTKKQL